MTLQRARERIAALSDANTDALLAYGRPLLLAADVLAILDKELADDLGAAWEEAEAALPEWWRLTVQGRPGQPELSAWWDATAQNLGDTDSVYKGGHRTPAAALLALAAALRARRP